MTEKRFRASRYRYPGNALVIDDVDDCVVCEVFEDRCPGMAERICVLLNKDEEEKGKHE